MVVKPHDQRGSTAPFVPQPVGWLTFANFCDFCGEISMKSLDPVVYTAVKYWKIVLRCFTISNYISLVV